MSGGGGGGFPQACGLPCAHMCGGMYMECSLVRWYEGGEMVRFREVHSVKFLEKVLPI